MKALSLFLCSVLLLAPKRARAHTGDWSLEFWAVAGLGIALALYASGLARLWRRAGVGRGVTFARAAAFAGACAVVALSLLPPLDALAAELVSAHMAQHMLLMMAAAPLFVAAAPLPIFLVILPTRARRAFVHQRPGRWWRGLSHPLNACLLQAVVLWAWHLPALYQWALSDDGVHMIEHASFLAAAALFWWGVAHRRARPAVRAGGILAVFATMVHSGMLAALMTFTSRPWYPAYGTAAHAWGLTPLEDQHLAGLIMWVPGGLLYLAAGVFLAAQWLTELDRRSARAAVASQPPSA